MNTSIRKRRHRLGFSWWATGLAALVAVVAAGGLAAQNSSPDAYTIEEDWQVVVGDPSYNANGPQITCTISPADMDTAYCAFDLNYHTQPDYQAGGLQIHTWDPTDPIEYANSVHNGIMDTSGETVTWTTRMSWKDGNLNFKIANGQSQTWGTFGGDQSHLQLSLPTTLSNLNSYSPEVSLDNSGVSFASNLVVSQTLMAVRWYDANGNLIKQIAIPQVVHPQQ
ncbi:MAG TPA: hypothetical protein VGH74_04435 [Planctomycetaceae bacterium]|jgi:hypothetical protein